MPTFKQAIILLSLIATIFLFYWFQIRPEVKLKECTDQVGITSKDTWKRWDEDGDGKLPADLAKNLMTLDQQAKDRCIKIWK